MKKVITLCITAIFATVLLAQAPQKMSYQAVVRNAAGELVTGQSIGMKITILQGSPGGTLVYQEIYNPNPQTNVNGLLSLEIGEGTSLIGTFSTIDWSNGPYYLMTETDPAGGTNYSNSGTSQLLSVPYALYAEKTGSFNETDPLWTVTSGNYYTKTNLQTGGQAPVHWDNLISVDADVEDLASDGILTGSKIGAGISADNITTGTLPLARLSGITGSQLSATAGITSGQINSLVASKMTGITPDFIPRSTGTGLVKGSITDEGTNVGIGSLVPEAKLHVRNYAGPQLMIGSSNQPAHEWYFTITPSADLSLLNENAGSPFSALHIDLTGGGGNVGIGTSTPSTRLEVNGQVKITGGTPASGEVLTSNAFGLATWEPVPDPVVNQVYSVGDFAQGGVVFWVDETGQHGLACAKTDQSDGVRWHAGTAGDTQAKGDGPYAGEANTSIIIAAQVAIGDDGNTYAARICNELQITVGSKTYGDWYLPSKEELNLMYNNKSTIDATAVVNGGSTFVSAHYWSSTESNYSYAWEQYFLNSGQGNYGKANTYRVRAVRAF